MTHTKITQDNKDATISKELWLTILVVIPFLSGLISLLLGKDNNWDLLNYHYYNAYAFLNHRLNFDIAPAQLQTFYNPILDIPFYLMTRHFPAWVAGFVLGFVHGLNLALIFLIFWKITCYSNKWLKFLYGICIMIVSSIAPGFISELGNTMNDNLTSLFILGTILILLAAVENIEVNNQRSRSLQISAAGLIMGLGVGLKPTLGIFAIGSACAFIAFQIPWLNKLKNLMTYGIMGLTGGFISAGFWWWELWSRYGNPIFPYYNHIFKSPYIAPVSFIDDHFLPSHLWEYFVWPLLFSRNSYLVNPLYFFDIRFGLLYLICLAWLMHTIIRRFSASKQKSIADSNFGFNLKSGNYLLYFFITTFVLWMIQFSNYRYIISLELLVPICFLIVLDRFVQPRKAQVFIAVSAALLTMVLFQPFNWGRLDDWGNLYFRVDTSTFNTSENILIVMLGRSPTAYVIPEFPKNFQFVRPNGNLFTFVNSSGITNNRGNNNQQIFFIEIESLLKKQQGSFYILYNKKEPNIYPEKSLQQMGIIPSIDECHLLNVNTSDVLEMCRVSK